MDNRTRSASKPKIGISFRSHVLSGGVACLAILALGLWLISSRANQNLVHDQATRAFESRAHLTLAELDRLRETARASAEALAGNPITEALTIEDREAHLPALVTILRAAPGVSAAYLGWPDGDFLLLRPVDERIAQLETSDDAVWMVQWITDGQPQFQFLNDALDIVQELPEVNYDLKPLTRPWFEAAQSTSETAVTSPYVFFTTREPGLTAARQAANGTIAAVDISLLDLSRRVSNPSEPIDIVSALLDRHGGVLAYKNIEQVEAVLDAYAADENSDPDGLPPAQDLEDPILTTLAERVRAGQNSFMSTKSLGGTSRLVLGRPIDDQGTTLVMHAPRSVFSTAAQDISRNLFILFGMATLVAIGLFWLAARQIARPVEQMADQVERLSTLDFHGEMTIKSHVREISHLSNMIFTMQTALGCYTDVLRNATDENDVDALIRQTLVLLQRITNAKRISYWPLRDKQSLSEPLCTVPEATRGSHTDFIPSDIAERICSLTVVEELVAETSKPGIEDSDGTGNRILCIPLKSRHDRPIGIIGVFRRPGVQQLDNQILTIAEAISRSLGLVIERRQLLEEHQAARQHSELIFSAVADGIHVLDKHGRVTQQNQAAEDMLGWKIDEIYLRSAHERIHHHRSDGSPHPTIECPIHRTLQDGETRIINADHFVDKKGERFPVEYECSAVRDDKGNINGAVVSFRDVTTRMKTQRRLRERVKELDCLYKVLEYTVSQSSSVDDICAGISHILPNSLVHDSIASARIRIDGEEYRSPDWQPPAKNLRSDIYIGENAVGFVEVGYNHDPPELPFEEYDHDAPFLKEEAAMISAVALHIGRMMHARQISDRLTQTERLKAVGELTGGIAHDFNNLLTVIIGNAELLADRLEGESAHADLAQLILNAAESGADLTHQLLAFARQQPLAPQTTDAEGLIRSMTTLMQRTLGDAIEINLAVTPELWPVTIDPTQLEGAVLNLAINARDAMPEGGLLTIELTNAYLDESYTDLNEDVTPGPYVLIAISDTGTGMDRELLHRVFEPFFTTKEKGTGNGLGLSMVYGFVKQSRGHIRIYSEPGQGTTVKLYLPRAHAELETENPEREEAGTRDNIEEYGTRILLVEDDDMVREHTTRLLESMGHVVRTAPNAPNALELIRNKFQFELLITDLVMPGGMNGYELASAAREIHPDLPVICVSGYADLAIIGTTQIAPDIAFLSKPFRRKELAATIRQALNRAGD